MKKKSKRKSKSKNKDLYTKGLVIGILSIPCGIIIAASGWILGIIGIVINSKNKKTCNTTAGFVLSIVGLVLSVTNSILGVLISVM